MCSNASFSSPHDPRLAGAQAAFQAISPGSAYAAFDVTSAAKATLGD
jgi:hypothetical protein